MTMVSPPRGAFHSSRAARPHCCANFCRYLGGDRRGGVALLRHRRHHPAILGPGEAPESAGSDAGTGFCLLGVGHSDCDPDWDRCDTKRFAPAQELFGRHFGSRAGFPAYGLIVLFFSWFGAGIGTVIVALATFSLLPVLRNTIVGLEQVDHAVIEAGRGMGYTKRQVLFEIELPLAVPVIIAGIRTAIVINIGMAALAFLIGGGGLGETINSGLKLDRNPAILIGAVLVAILGASF
jgi:hypothetical protein